MLVENLFSTSVETSLLNVSEYQDPFAAYDWASLAETYQMIHKFPKKSQASFLESAPLPDTMNLDESKHPEIQVSCPEKFSMRKISEKALTSLVYSRRKKSVTFGETAEHNLGRNTNQDASLNISIVSVHSPGENTKGKNLFNNSLVYSRKKRRRKSSCNLTEETKIRDHGLDDAFSSEHDCGETKSRCNQLDSYFVYIRRKCRVRSNSCSFTHHDSGRTKISGDQADPSADSQREQRESDIGEVKNIGLELVYSQSKQLVISNDSFTESHIGETKRNGDRSDILLRYSRRKKRGKTLGVRVNGFLVYSRRKNKVKSRSTFTEYNPRETKKNGKQLSLVCSHAPSVPGKYANRDSGTCSLELVDDSNQTSEKCSSLQSSSEIASSSSKSGEDEASDCHSSDGGMSETDTDGSSSSFRQCKHCGKPGPARKMLNCDKCEEAYHTSCCGVGIKKVEEIDDWLCPSCWKNKSSKTKIKRRVSRERKLRVREPFVKGIRIEKEFQADVPDWSGPTMSDTSYVGEPLEIDLSEYMQDLKKAKNGKKPGSAVNWLQCREEDTNGDICGKWRRAPRSEVQTKDWECFCCVFWDPSGADCSVPQELETSEILKQLKYIKMLRPRSDAKKRKIGPKGRSRSHNKTKS